jgi:hypothetical protein
MVRAVPVLLVYYTYMYSHELVNNHIIAKIGGKNVLIDTGAPSSIGEGSLRLNGTDFALPGTIFMGVTLDSISDSVGIQLDVLMGADILQQTGLFVWFYKKQINFSDMSTPNISIDFCMGIPIATINILGNPVRACVDTGAQYSYISPGLAGDLPVSR